MMMLMMRMCKGGHDGDNDEVDDDVNDYGGKEYGDDVDDDDI